MDEENGKEMGIGNGGYKNICRFLRNDFCKNIGCPVSDPTFGIGGSSMW